MQQNKYSAFQALAKFSKTESALSKLLNRANNILTHQETVRATLEPSCREHCWLANYRNGVLYLQTDSAAWGTRIRMQQRNIIRSLTKERAFSGLNSVKVSIQPRYKSTRPNPSAKPVSLENTRHIRETALSIEDEKLKAALERLAKNIEKQKNG